MKVWVVVWLCLLLGVEVYAQQPENFQYIRNLIENGDTAVAKIRLQEYLKNNPESVDATNLLARSFILEGNANEAEITLRSLKNPNPESLWIKGTAFAELGDPETAIKLLQQAAQSSKNYEYAMDWGVVAWRFGDLDIAIQAYKLAEQISPNEPWGYLNHAMVLHSTAKYTDALKLLEQAAQALERSAANTDHPAYPEIYYWMGQCYQSLKNKSKAQEMYRKALRYDPHHSTVLKALADLGKIP